MADAPDPLFDTSEPAMSLRLARFKQRVGFDAGDHAMMSLTIAVEDIAGALLIARTVPEISQLRACAEDATMRLIHLSSLALALGENLQRQS